MSKLLDQAPEVLHDIFNLVDPTDLASVSSTCRYLHTFISRDALLWRQQYLAHHDPPAATDVEPDWSQLLRRNIRFQKLLQSSNDSIKTEDELQQLAELASYLLLHSSASPDLNTAWLRDLFTDNESSISSFLCRSSLFRGARRPSNTPASTVALQQLSAKLHVFSGLELEPPCPSLSSDPEIRQVHPYARSRVYDLRRYKRANHWGPFTDDGTSSIDWEKVQAIMLDLAYNIRMYAERGGSDFSFHTTMPYRSSPFNRGRRRDSNSRRAFSGSSAAIWDTPFYGLAPNSFVSQPLSGTLRAPPSPELDSRDPYGVSGTWMRIVCFLDYSDLYNFNFDSPRPPSDAIEREPIDTREAFRLIRLKLHVTSVDEPEEGDHQDWPVVSFTGTSRSTLNPWDPNANSRIRGTVRTTPSGAIRWTTFSIFHNEERWRSEGVQVGGIRSARGILGNWFDRDYDAAGPAGPTCFWKISDDVVEDPKHPHAHLGHGAQGWWAGPDVDVADGEGEDGGEDGDGDEWVDDDSDDEGDGEGYTGGEGGGGGPVIGSTGTFTLADLAALAAAGQGHGVVTAGHGNGADGQQPGLVLPLHEFVHLLTQALNGAGGGGGGDVTLRLEDIQELLE